MRALGRAVDTGAITVGPNARSGVRSHSRTPFELAEISPDMADALVGTYTSVFAGPETFEVEKCRWCGRAYPGPEESRPAIDASYARGSRCWNPECARPLELMSYYEDPDERLAEQVVTNALAQDAFVGYVARDLTGDLIGFAWGYRLPRVVTPTVDFSSTHVLLAQLGVSPATAFYAAEIGVVAERQRAGVAKHLATARFRAAASLGFSHICFRTVDRRRVVTLYEAMFGAGAVRELFSDPDPAKDQIWFAAELADLVVSER